MSGKGGKRGKPSAYDLLGLDHNILLERSVISDQLEQFLTQLPEEGFRMPRDPFYYLQLSDSDEAHRIITRYLNMPEWTRKFLPMEAYCLAEKIPAMRILEIVFSSAIWLSEQHTRVAHILAHRSAPDLMRRAIENASLPDNFKDRQMLFKTTGLLPTPRGPSVKVNVNQSNQTVAVSPAPPPEQTIRRLVDRFNESRPQLMEVAGDDGDE